LEKLFAQPQQPAGGCRLRHRCRSCGTSSIRAGERTSRPPSTTSARVSETQDGNRADIGTDCPVLRPAHLRKAARASIDGDDAVFYAAEDGGYVLVGLRRPQAALCDGMTWSTADVMFETRARARSLGLRVRVFETLWDVDMPDDPARLEAMTIEAAAISAWRVGLSLRR